MTSGWYTHNTTQECDKTYLVDRVSKMKGTCYLEPVDVYGCRTRPNCNRRSGLVCLILLCLVFWSISQFRVRGDRSSDSTRPYVQTSPSVVTIKPLLFVSDYRNYYEFKSLVYEPSASSSEYVRTAMMHTLTSMVCMVYPNWIGGLCGRCVNTQHVLHLMDAEHKRTHNLDVPCDHYEINDLICANYDVQIVKYKLLELYVCILLDPTVHNILSLSLQRTDAGTGEGCTVPERIEGTRRVRIRPDNAHPAVTITGLESRIEKSLCCPVAGSVHCGPGTYVLCAPIPMPHCYTCDKCNTQIICTSDHILCLYVNRFGESNRILYVPNYYYIMSTMRLRKQKDSCRPIYTVRMNTSVYEIERDINKPNTMMYVPKCPMSNSHEMLSLQNFSVRFDVIPVAEAEHTTGGKRQNHRSVTHRVRPKIGLRRCMYVSFRCCKLLFTCGAQATPVLCIIYIPDDYCVCNAYTVLKRCGAQATPVLSIIYRPDDYCVCNAYTVLRRCGAQATPVLSITYIPDDYSVCNDYTVLKRYKSLYPWQSNTRHNVFVLCHIDMYEFRVVNVSMGLVTKSYRILLDMCKFVDPSKYNDKPHFLMSNMYSTMDVLCRRECTYVLYDNRYVRQVCTIVLYLSNDSWSTHYVEYPLPMTSHTKYRDMDWFLDHMYTCIDSLTYSLSLFTYRLSVVKHAPRTCNHTAIIEPVDSVPYRKPHHIGQSATSLKDIASFHINKTTACSNRNIPLLRGGCRTYGTVHRNKRTMYHTNEYHNDGLCSIIERCVLIWGCPWGQVRGCECIIMYGDMACEGSMYKGIIHNHDQNKIRENRFI